MVLRVRFTFTLRARELGERDSSQLTVLNNSSLGPLILLSTIFLNVFLFYFILIIIFFFLMHHSVISNYFISLFIYIIFQIVIEFSFWTCKIGNCLLVIDLVLSLYQHVLCYSFWKISNWLGVIINWLTSCIYFGN